MTREKLFPNFRYEPGMLEYVAYQSLRTKWAQRMIMQDSPFVQPSEFYLVLTPKNLRQRLEEEFGGEFADTALDPMYVNREHAASIDQIVKMIEDSDSSFVYKPNNAAIGIGICFIEKQDDKYVVSMRTPENIENKKGVPGSIVYAENSEGFCHDGNIYRLEISGSKKNKVLKDLLFHATADSVPYFHELEIRNVPGTFDPGLVESLIKSWKFKGLAYETRHEVKGNLHKEQVDKIIDDHSRLGGSSFFANQWLTYDTSMISTFYGEKMYNPLFTELISESRKAEFKDYVENGLREAFLHHARKLNEEGFVFDHPCVITFDLMWIPPNNPGDFPMPAMAECEWKYKKVAMLEIPPSTLEYNDWQEEGR